MNARETAEQYKYPILVMEIAFEYKYQITMEIVKRNTSKQVSAKKTALWNVYNYLRRFFFFRRVVNAKNRVKKMTRGKLGS